jgi:hypothetical protein
MKESFEKAAAQVKLLSDESSKLYYLIQEILENEEWQRLSRFPHHVIDTRANHSLRVCCRAFKMANYHNNSNLESIAIGSLLHDFFLYGWIDKSAPNEGKFYRHLCIHPIIAFENSKIHFPHLLEKDYERIKDIIIKHMFPFPITRIPSYPESWIVTFADKRDTMGLFTPKSLEKLADNRNKPKTLILK